METKKLYRKLAQLCHPDRQGGNNALMTRVNACRHNAKKLHALGVELGVVTVKSNRPRFWDLVADKAYICAGADPDLTRPPNFITDPYWVGVCARGEFLAPIWCKQSDVPEINDWISQRDDMLKITHHFKYDEIPPQLIAQYKKLYKEFPRQRQAAAVRAQQAAARAQQAALHKWHAAQSNSVEYYHSPQEAHNNMYGMKNVLLKGNRYKSTVLMNETNMRRNVVIGSEVKLGREER